VLGFHRGFYMVLIVVFCFLSRSDDPSSLFDDTPRGDGT
jgi:hypothetical protein